MGEKDISKTQYIIYNIDEKIYKIKIYGMILKIGDIGSSIIKPKKDISSDKKFRISIIQYNSLHSIILYGYRPFGKK
jgi:hypothetical protein